MKKLPALLFLPLILFFSCSKDSAESDAWGNFEANEVLISAEMNGKILSFPVEEGDILSKGDFIAYIDTAMLVLQKKEIEASEKAVASNISTIISQNKILEQQITNLDVNISRVKKMLEDQAATQKQYDDLSGQKAVLQRQIDANNTRISSVRSELSVLAVKKDQLMEQMRRCRIEAPLGGTVLQKYAETGEITAAGRPLAKIADLNNMNLKVYISGAQLAEVKIGDKCTVKTDHGNKGFHEFTGKVIKVSDKAEFTPKIIQTKEERVSMVYAVTIAVENDGRIKSGMPGEVIF